MQEVCSSPAHAGKVRISHYQGDGVRRCVQLQASVAGPHQVELEVVRAIFDSLLRRHARGESIRSGFCAVRSRQAACASASWARGAVLRLIPHTHHSR